jgi:hypothetical protein
MSIAKITQFSNTKHVMSTTEYAALWHILFQNAQELIWRAHAFTMMQGFYKGCSTTLLQNKQSFMVYQALILSDASH